MLQKLLKRAAAGLFGIVELAAELRGRAPDENHFLLRGWKEPFGISRGHVFALKIGGLVASVAAHAVDTVAVLAALYILQMNMAVVALERGITWWMAVLAARGCENPVDL